MNITIKGCPWKEHLFKIEKQLGIEGQILYVLYKNKETDWRIQVCMLARFFSFFSIWRHIITISSINKSFVIH